MNKMMNKESGDSAAFAAEYGRLKDDILFRLRSANQFELAAITAMGLVLTLGSVFGEGQFHWVGNLAAAGVLYGCAQSVVPNVYTVYSAFAFIHARVALGQYPASLVWDTMYPLVQARPKIFPPDAINLNHHSFLFSCLSVVNIVALAVGTCLSSQYVLGGIIVLPALAVFWPIRRIDYIYLHSQEELYKAWHEELSKLATQNTGGCPTRKRVVKISNLRIWLRFKCRKLPGK
jgi:hypothetical protein